MSRRQSDASVVEQVTAAARTDASVAVVSGSGLAVVPDGVEIEAEIAYSALGWPVTAVSGHPSRLLVGRLASAGAASAGADRRPLVLFCCGRPHRYEGWSPDELRRPVRDLAAWGVRRLVSTNACGALAADLDPGAALVVDEIVDLQRAPHDRPPVLTATPAPLAEAALAALTSFLPARRGRYVALSGPEYETPAQAAWLRRLADVVGMSTTQEAESAAEAGMEHVVVSLVVNRSGASVGHAEVLEAGARLQRALGPALAALLRACWPQGDATVATAPSASIDEGG